MYGKMQESCFFFFQSTILNIMRVPELEGLSEINQSNPLIL